MLGSKRKAINICFELIILITISFYTNHRISMGAKAQYLNVGGLVWIQYMDFLIKFHY